MERNYAEELDALKTQMNDVKKTLEALAARIPAQEEAPAAEQAPLTAQAAGQFLARLTERNAKAPLNAEDALRMAELTARLSREHSGANPTVGHVEKMPDMHPIPEVSAILSRLEDSCGQNGNTGRITYMGVFASGGRQSTWVKNDLNTDDLLTLIENRTAEKMLACIGSNDRLNMLLAILRKPRTVAELVSDCGCSSTGQVYHHLKPLIAADLIVEDKAHRGAYIIQPHRVQGVIMLLAGVADLVDGTYTQGDVG